MLTSCSFIFSHLLIRRNSTCQPTNQHDISIKDKKDGGVKPLDFPDLWQRTGTRGSAKYTPSSDRELSPFD